MESRLERYLKQKEQKKKNKRKYILIFFLVIFLFIAISIVDNSIAEYLGFKDMNVFNYEFNSSKHEFELFGNKFYIREKPMDNVINEIKETFGRAKSFINEVFE